MLVLMVGPTHLGLNFDHIAFNRSVFLLSSFDISIGGLLYRFLAISLTWVRVSEDPNPNDKQIKNATLSWQSLDMVPIQMECGAIWGGNLSFLSLHIDEEMASWGGLVVWLLTVQHALFYIRGILVGGLIHALQLIGPLEEDQYF